MKYAHRYQYPPHQVLNFDERVGSFSTFCVLLIILGGITDLLFGFPSTSIPYNYPFFMNILLFLVTVLILKRTHRKLWDVVQELITLIELNEDDPLSLDPGVDVDNAQTELENVLYLSYHPAVLLAGALLGGSLVFIIMYVLNVFSAYPYPIYNFGFGAAHGVFFGPVIGGIYIFYRALRRYIVDVNLLDPDGRGGYREIGDTLVTLTAYGIFFVTLDFIILSSVAFTQYTDFQIVVSVMFLGLLTGFVVGVFGTTVLVRRRLLNVRDRKVELMQTSFHRLEHGYWEKHQHGENPIMEAINILTMYAIFHQMSRMNMWPVNLYSFTKLGVSVLFSLSVFIIELTGVLF